MSQLAPERGRGSAWMAGIGPDCLMTVLDLEVEGAVDLTSCGPGYFCLGIMSPSCLETMPRPVSAPGPAGLVMYCQDAGSYAYRLKPRTPYVSRSLCFTPRFWEQLAFDRRSDGDALLERFATAPQVLNAPHVGAMLQRLDARTADAAATELHLTALAAEAVACLMDTAEAEGQAEAARGSSEAARLARDARALLERHLDAPLTLESIARELCVSRSRLAATYKAERGTCGWSAPASFWPARTSLCPRWAAPWAIRARLPSPPPSPARSAAPPPPGANSTASETALLRDPVVGPL